MAFREDSISPILASRVRRGSRSTGSVPVCRRSSCHRTCRRALLPFGVDLGLAANFPTLGEAAKALLVFLCPNPDAGVIGDGDRVWLVSKEMGLVADNVLGAWADSHDCYYYDLYLNGPFQGKWITTSGGGGPWTIQPL